MTPTMKLESWRPWHSGLSKDADGGTRQTIRGRYMEVHVLTYPGGEHGEAFTDLRAYFGGTFYGVKLPKAYHPRWFGRLAAQFEHQAWQDAKARKAV